MSLFTRQLDKQGAPGVQLNALVDNSEITVDQRDQFFAAMLRLKRGRVDRPFLVLAGDTFAKVGLPNGFVRDSMEYRSHVALTEALKNGAAGAVVQRLVPAGSVNKYIVVKSGTSITLTPTIQNGVIKAMAVTNGGSGYGHPTLSIDGTPISAAGVWLDISCTTGAIKKVTLAGGTTFGALANGDAVTLTGVTGTGFAGVLANVKGDGSLNGATVTITDAGSGYRHPTITKTGPGSGAEFVVTMPITGTSAGKINTVRAIGGSGYAIYTAATPSVLTITDMYNGYAEGTGATVRITDTDDGVITDLTAPVASGDYLSSVPPISIRNVNGGTGSGAVATATVDNGDITDVTIVSGGSGYVGGKVLVTANLATSPQFIPMVTLPDPDVEPYLFAIRDMECYNNGVIVALHCEEKTNTSGVQIATSRISLRIIDPAKPGSYRYQFIGDLTDGGADDFGGSTFLPDVVSRKTDNIEIYPGSDSVISPSSLMYGTDDDDNQKWVTSDILKAFWESQQAFTANDYRAARVNLAATPLDFQYIASLDTDSVAILSELCQLAYSSNRNLRFDVQGDTVAEAVDFVLQLNLPERPESHLLHAFWSPMKVEDPSGNNGSIRMGAATLNIAYACRRNRAKDSRGFAPKHYAIMGRDWPITRRNIRMLLTLTEGQRNQLARAKINPVIYENGQYIFGDAITCANVDVSLRKLIAVTDMSTSIDDAVVRQCNNVKGYPIKEAVKQTTDYLKTLFEGAESAGWLTQSDDPDMGGKAFKYTVTVNPDRPYDSFIVNYWLRYQGTVRQIEITQTYTK